MSADATPPTDEPASARNPAEGSPEWPPWLDRGLYPFARHRFPTPAGAMNYLDEGAGRPVVFVHGNPTWSFQFREVVKLLRETHRCVAPDHLGFGLSDKPPEFSYLPADHAKNFAALMDQLALTDVTLVVGDWGGPIGLSWALDHPERVSSLVITNTWLWSVKREWYYRGFSGFMGGAIGRWLIRKRNFFANRVVRAAFGDKRRLTSEIHRHYLAPLATPEDRKGSWVFPRAIIGESDWLASLWERRAALAGTPMVLAWGMKDIAFREQELRRWQAAFPAARSTRFPDVGHFVAEEKPEELAALIRELCA